MRRGGSDLLEGIYYTSHATHASSIARGIQITLKNFIETCGQEPKCLRESF